MKNKNVLQNSEKLYEKCDFLKNEKGFRSGLKFFFLISKVLSFRLKNKLARI